MPIPGYDPDDIDEFELERETAGGGATASVAAGVVPDDARIEPGGSDAPDGALSDPVRFVGFGDVDGVDAIRVELEYDPSALPADADPDDVAVGVVTGEGVEALESTVDAERAVVSATTTESPPGETMVAIHDDG